MESTQTKEYINAPMELYQGFLESPEKRNNCLNDVLRYEIGKTLIQEPCYTLMDALHSLGRVYSGHEPDEYAEECKSFFHQHQGERKVYFSISIDQFDRFYDEDEDETDEERTLFIAYLALKSIIGDKPFYKTNKYLWLARMDCKSKSVQSIDDLSEQVRRYATTYQQRRMRELLESYYNVLFWSKSLNGCKGGLKGFYFTLTLDPNEFMSALLKTRDKQKRCSRAIEFERAMQAALKMTT